MSQAFLTHFSEGTFLSRRSIDFCQSGSPTENVLYIEVLGFLIYA